VALAHTSSTHGPVGLMYAIVCLGAIAAAIGGPARSALVPQIIPPQVLANAYTWNSSFFQIAAVVGPAAGGLLLHYSIPAVYLVDACMSLIFAINLIAFIRVRPVERVAGATGLRALTEGIRWVWQHQIILATISLDLFAVLLGGAVYLLPVYAKLLNVGELGFGWLRAAPAIGAFGMALLLAHLPPMKNAGRSMLLAVAGFGVATIVFGLTPLGHQWLPTGKFLGGTLWYWIALIALLLTGAFDNISVVVRHTLVQVLAPDSMRGRISAVNNVFIGASNELGGFESGLTARLFNPIISVVGGGIGTIVVVAATAVTWPQLRRFGALHEAKTLELKEPPGFEPVMKPEQQPT
jgi:MFS family permease